MRIAWLVMVLIGYCMNSFGQDSFIKKIEKEETIRARQIIKYKERLFIMNTGVCDQLTQCSTIMEIDEMGNLIWEKRLPWLDVSSRSMVIENDTIFLSGNHNSSQEKFLFHQMSINEGDSLATYDILVEENQFTNMFNLGLNRIKDVFFIYGTGKISNGEDQYSLIYCLDKNGQVDTLLTLFPSDFTSAIWDAQEDADGNLCTFIMLDSLGSLEGKRDFRKIVRLDKNYNVIWEVTTGQVDNPYAAPKGEILNDGRIVFVTGNQGFNLNLHSIQALNPDSTASWQYFSPNENTFHRRIINIEKANDGNLFGFGEWGITDDAPRVDEAPWIFKMSSEGELLWERVYYELREGEALAKFGQFFDAVELDDNSILAVGGMRSENSDILLARFDSEGCLMYDCAIQNDVTDLLTDVNEPEREVGVSIFPNPVSVDDRLNVTIDDRGNSSLNYTLEVFNTSGEQLQEEKLSKGTQTVELRCKKGLHIIRVKKEGKVIYREKVVML